MKKMPIAILSAAVLLGENAMAQAPDVDVERFTYVEMSDGVTLHAAVLKPKTKGPFPTVIISSPYGDSVAGPFTRPVPILLKNGYAVVVSDWRGTGCSGGALDTASERFVRDGYELVEWVAGQPWSTGAVGMGGPSARGAGAILYAKGAPPSLKAIAPQTFQSNVYRDVTHRGGVPHYLDALYWSLLGQPMESQRIAGKADEQCKENRRQHTNTSAMQSFQMLAFPHDNPNYAMKSTAYEVERVNVPTLLMQGTHDHYGPATAAWYFQDIDAPLRIILAAGGHGVSRIRETQEELVAWFDHYLKGEDNGADRDAKVKALFNTDVNLDVGFERRYDAWPPEETEYETFYLAPDGALSETKPSRRSTASYRASATPPLHGQEYQPALVRNDFSQSWQNLQQTGLRYATTPLEDALELVGNTRLSLHASVSTVDTDFIAMLTEEDAEGNITYVMHTTLRASHNAIDEAMSAEKGYLIRSHDVSIPLTPNEMYEFKIEFPPIAHRLEQGSRLRLALLPAWAATAVLGWDIIPLPYEGTVAIRQGGRSGASRLSLPVVARGLDAPAPPACGARYYQPCRPASGEAANISIQPEEDL